MTTSVLVVDDQPLIRSAVTDLIGHETDLEVAGEAADGRAAVEAARRLRPDVVLMDIRMPVLDGLEATRQICADPALAQSKVLILTTFEEDDYVLQALRAGASGFVGKGADPAELVQAIRMVEAGDALLSPRATRALIEAYTSTPAPGRALRDRELLTTLTERETEVLILVAEGHSNGQIAEQLTISPMTAKTHVNRVMTKLSAHDRAQLVILAYENGLVVPGR